MDLRPHCVGQLKKHRVVKRWHEPISSPKRHCRSRSATETILGAHFALSLEIHLLFDIAASFVFPCKGLRALNNLIPRYLGSEIGPRKRHPNGCTIALLSRPLVAIDGEVVCCDERA